MKFFRYFKKVFLLVLILSSITLSVTLISTYTDYNTAVKIKMSALSDIVNGRKAFIQTLYSHGISKDSIILLMSQNYDTSTTIGETGEFVVGELLGDGISFIYRKDITGKQERIKTMIEPNVAGPMKKALKKERGSIQAHDYAGKHVFAGYNYFEPFGWGIVAKINVEEMNDPFIESFLWSMLYALILTFLGSWLFIRITHPMIDKIIESEENLLTTLNSIGDGVIATDVNGRINRINPIASRLCGFEESSAIGKYLDEVFIIVNSETRKKANNPVHSVLKNGAIVGLANHTSLLSNDGTEYHIADSAAPIKDKNGNITGVILVFSDVSEKYAREMEIKKNEEKFRTLVENIHDALYVDDVDGNILFANKEFFNMFGYDESEFSNLSLSDFTAPEDREILIERHKLRLAGANVLQKIIYRGVRKDGTKLWIDARVNPLYEGDKIVGTQSIHRDITDQRDAEIALFESDKRFRLLYENAPLSYQSLDSNACLIDVNPEWLRTMGFDNINEVIGRHFSEFMTEESALAIKERYLNFLEKGEIHNYEFEMVKKDGTHFFVSYEGRIGLDSIGKFKQTHCIFTDITDRKLAQDQLLQQNQELEAQYEEYMQLNEVLRQTNYELEISKDKAEESDKLKTAFLQNMSHEIRTPLNGILGFSNLISTDEFATEDIQEFSNMIHKSGLRLLSLVNNILDISRINTGQLPAAKAETNVNCLLDELVLFFSPCAEDLGLEIRSKSPNDSTGINIITDENKLNQILTNLLSNAIKFTKIGSIEVGYTITDNFMKFYVNDTGIGISEDFQSRLFERFAQEDTNLNRDFEGAGLGLAICKGLVELLGGEIWVESELGKGSCFYFTLPIVN